MTQKINSVTFVPSQPLEYAGKTYTELTFKRPKVGNLASMDAVDGELHKVLVFLASLSGVPVGAIEELDLEDLQRLAESIRPLTGDIIGGASITAATAA